MRISAVVFAVGCFLGGYTVAGYRVSASPADDVAVRRLPRDMNTGDTVTLTFSGGAVASGMMDVQCRIADISGIWVRCASADNSLDSSREQVWYDTTRVTVVKKVARY
jgi:hypothetical protein